jgi:hypothetical protein
MLVRTVEIVSERRADAAGTERARWGSAGRAGAARAGLVAARTGGVVRSTFAARAGGVWGAFGSCRRAC